jgi:uncharacterized protein with HEPN domain
MSERKASLFVKDIINCIDHIQLHTSNVSFDEFCSSFLITEACLYNIQVIGEAVSKIPADIKEQEKQIPWQLIKGMRNRLIHQYFGTDLQLVWNVIQNELPSFRSELQLIFRKLIEQGR